MVMSLTTGSGPFGTRPAGHFNKPMPEFSGLLYLEPFAPRIRGTVGDQTVVDSTSAWLLHEHGQLPVLYFPTADVRMDLLEPNGVRSHSPGKGEATHYRLTMGDRIVEEAAWTFPAAEMHGLAGLIGFYFPTMQTWRQEDEPMTGHARNPYHRIDVFDTSRHVRILVARSGDRRDDPGESALRERPPGPLVPTDGGRRAELAGGQSYPDNLRIQGAGPLRLGSGG